MKTITRIYLILPLLLTLLQGNAQEQLTSPDQMLQNLIKEHDIAGAAAAYSYDGEVMWMSGAGYSNMEEQIAFTESTLSRIASLAKPMTAIAIMQLVEQEKIDLDLPIATYIPDYPQKAKTLITTRHLLTHTSGIDGYKNAKEAENKVEYANLEAAMHVFQDRDLLFEPGTNMGYTSYGYVVLGVIIEKASGMSYEDYMQKNIWDKVGMENTGIEKAGMTYENKSLLYRADKGKIKKGKPNNLSNRTPGGGFYSTVEDLIKFGNAVINNTLIKESSLAAMCEVSFKREQGTPYGFGWFLYGPTPQEGAVFGHGGAQTGTNAQILINLPRKLVSVVVANTSSTGNASIIGGIALLNTAKAKHFKE